MLEKIQRLTKDKEFDNVFKKGKSSYNKVIGVKALKNELGLCRLGIIVSNKVSQKAVQRNKLKRQFREIIKPKLKSLGSGHDIVVIVLPFALGKTYQELETAVEQVFKKLKLS